ncbi:MAG: undecaprenyl-diphosphate phosphatase [Erysipelotrichaceae bacterium]
MIEIIKAIILGIIEGITEWLPISSTGHMILVDEFIKLNVSEEFMEMFLVVIQLGAIMAVVVLFFNKLVPISTRNGIKLSKSKLKLWAKILIASIPAALIGLPFNDVIDEWFYNYVVVALALIIYGFLFIDIENHHQGKTAKVNSLNEITYKQSLLMGIFQVLALIPGTSRSGATILGGLMMGLSRGVAAEFSFFMAIPAMFGASLIKVIKFGFSFTNQEIIILSVGCFVAFIVSILAIRFLMNFVKKYDFKVFGYYRIILGLVVLVYFFLKSVGIA